MQKLRAEDMSLWCSPYYLLLYACFFQEIECSISTYHSESKLLSVMWDLCLFFEVYTPFDAWLARS